MWLSLVASWQYLIVADQYDNKTTNYNHNHSGGIVLGCLARNIGRVGWADIYVYTNTNWKSNFSFYSVFASLVISMHVICKSIFTHSERWHQTLRKCKKTSLRYKGEASVRSVCRFPHFFFLITIFQRNQLIFVLFLPSDLIGSLLFIVSRTKGLHTIFWSFALFLYL